MNFIVKDFKDLSTKEIFEIYKLRIEVFIVEQNCIYQDIDEKDLNAKHVMLFNEESLIAYCRILSPGVSYNNACIGRVVVAKNSRNTTIGKEVMKFSINKTLQLFKNQDIIISAQAYLIRFYKSLGFFCEGQEYFEDNILHIQMRYKI